MHIKPFLSALLAAALALSLCACGDTAAPSVAAKGQYTETQLDLPLPSGGDRQGLIGIFNTASGVACICAVTVGEGEDFRLEYYRHTVAPDGTVSTAPETWLTQLAPQGGNMMDLRQGADGSLFMAYGDYDKDLAPVNHIVVSRDGGQTGGELTGGGIKACGTIFAVAPLEDGAFAVQDEGGALLLMDADGALVKELEAGNGYGSLASWGNKLAAYAPSGKAVRVFDTATGDSVDWDIQLSQAYTYMSFAPDGTLYLACPTGVYSHTPDGTLWEQLVDGPTTNLGLPDYYVSSMAVVPGDTDEIYLSDYSAQLFRYGFDAAAPTTSGDTLAENSIVQKAVVDFNRSHRDVKVNYTVADTASAGATGEDYIKALNTQLLAGSGPDIIIMDGLPLASYIEKGVLADLSAAVGSGEPLLQNILSASRVDGALYAVPLGFRLPLTLSQSGDGAAFDSLASLAAACEASGKKPFLSSSAYSLETLTELLLKYYGGELLTGEENAAESFLTRAMTISSAIGSGDRLGGDRDVFGDMPEDEVQEYLRGYTFIMQLFDYAGGAVDQLAMSVRTLEDGDCMVACGLADQYGGSFHALKGSFIPTGLAAVNKASSRQALAEEFITALLSDGAQKAFDYSSGFPVNSSVLEKYFARSSSNSSSSYRFDDGGEVYGEWPSQARRDELWGIIAGLSTPVYSSAQLHGMLAPAIVSYLDGSLSLEAACDELLSVLGTYISE